jgi:very-short-patch-repair endonuclease
MSTAKSRFSHQDETPLTGWVHGLEASDIEERFARALRGINKEFSFQIQIPTAISIPHEEKEVDFILDNIQPVEVDGEIGHKTIAQKENDSERDALLNTEFMRMGMLPIIRIPGWRLDTQELADNTVRELI